MKHSKIIAGALSMSLLMCGCASKKNSSVASSTPTPTPKPTTTPIPTVEPETAAQKANDYLAQMDLNTKVEQMLMPAIRTWSGSNFTAMNDEVDALLGQFHFGGIILFRENMTSDSAATVQLTQALQESATKGGGAPLFIGTDQEGGNVYRLMSGTTMPSSMAIAATGDTSNAKLAGTVTSEELKALGFNTDFAPDLDVNSNPANPIIGIRSYSDDAATVASYATEFIQGMMSNSIIATGKHFPGHGDTDTDSHTGLPTISKTKEELESTDLVSFKNAVEGGIEMIMSAHIQYPNIETETYTSIKDGSEIYLPSTLSHTMITDILRTELGFNGVVSTDSLQMGAIQENFSTKDSAKLAINAGVDILLMPVELTDASVSSQVESYVQDIVDMVNNGEISEDTINAAVTRILTLKYTRGIMDIPYGTDHTNELLKEAANAVGCLENAESNRELSEKAVTVLQNNNNVLPYKANGANNIVVLTVNADQKRAMDFGFFRLQDEGVISQQADVTVVSEDYGDSYEAAIDAIAGADLVIVVSMMTAGVHIDATQSARVYNIELQIKEAKNQGIPVVAISSGVPYDTPLLTEADAVICTYNNIGVMNCDDYWKPIGTYSESLPSAMDVIFGKVNPTGKLPVNIYEISNNSFTSNVVWQRGYGITY